MNGLEKITNRILEDARAEAASIMDSAEKECEKIRADYAAKAEGIRQRIVEDAERDGADIVARAKASSANERRAAVLRLQSSMLEETFESAKQQIRNQDGEQYTKTLVGLLSTALAEQVRIEKESLALYGEEEAPLSESYEVIFNQQDRDRYGEAVVQGARIGLRGTLSNEQLEKLSLSPRTALIEGGLILKYGSIETNCSLELIFEQLRGELEQEVSRALFTAPKQF